MAFRYLVIVAVLLTHAEWRIGRAAEIQSADNVSNRPVDVSILTNFNNRDAGQPEFSEFIFRGATSGNGPVPPISDHDLAHGLKPHIIVGKVHPLSGPPEKLTDGNGAATDDDPRNCLFFDNEVPVGRFRVSLPKAEPVAQINLFAWHRNALSGGVRAPLKLSVYASDGTEPNFDANDPHGPGYVRVADVNTIRLGGVAAQSGQHGASVNPSARNSLGTFRHFLFEVQSPVDGLTHTFFSEIDLVRATDTPPRVVTAESTHFDEHIAPLLAKRCLDCHNTSDRKGGLDLTRADTAAAGGDSGVAIAPGRPEKSFLFERVTNDEMPPKHPLPPHEKQLLHDWLAAGAPWGSDPIDRFQFTSETRAGFDWWALQPLASSIQPDTKNKTWSARPIDAFVLARLEAEGLSAAPPADRRTLIRRVTFDLIGLPPTPEEVAAFINEPSPDAYQRLVDRLLASPHYGERWARHWLDLVRFAESQGFERNKFYPSAWRYRDWVIQAFNTDLPYDEFVRLQLAGDVLHPDEPHALIATEYLVCGPRDLLGLSQGSDAMKASTREDELEDLVGNVSQTFLGLTVNCARCHDHKFDPLYQSEYYQLAAALGGILRNERPLPRPQTESTATGSARDSAMASIEVGLTELLGGNGAASLQQARTEILREAEKEAERVKTASDTADQSAAKGDANMQQMAMDRRRDFLQSQDLLVAARSPHATIAFDRVWEHLPAAQRAACATPLMALSQLEMHASPLLGGTAHGFVSAPPQFFHVLARGSFRQPGVVVAARGLSCVGNVPSDWGLTPDAPESQRRLRLAQWITDPRNPLPARVIVNRLWHYHFGVGLVETPNDFGYNGGQPSHLQLLDWLAVDLVRHGWSLKHIQREIVLSAAYQQSGQFNAAAAQVDIGNRLLWRKTPSRLEAEATRDAILAVSGELNPRMGGPSFRDLQLNVQDNNASYQPIDVFSATVNRRTVYRTVVRAATPPLLDTLDCADPAVATPRRTVTTTPLQALSLLNNPFMRKAADAFAERVRRECEEQPDRQIDRAYQLAFGREATVGERETAQRFVADHGLAELCLMIFNSNEFVYLD